MAWGVERGREEKEKKWNTRRHHVLIVLIKRTKIFRASRFISGRRSRDLASGEAAKSRDLPPSVARRSSLSANKFCKKRRRCRREGERLRDRDDV